MALSLEKLFHETAGTGELEWTDRDVAIPRRGTMSIREARHHDDAPTLLLLHGLGATGRLNWFTSIPALAERFNVVVVNHRGHGGGIRTNNFRLADCADDAIALADELGIESVYSVGYSMGGPIAKLTSIRHPDRVRGLVLCATANKFSRPAARGVVGAVMPGLVAGARLAPEFVKAQIVAFMLRTVPPGERRDAVEREMLQSDPATILQAARATLEFSSTDWAKGLSVPTAVVITTRDTIVPVRRQERLAESIPGARVFKVEGDHLACVAKAARFVPTLVSACEHVTGNAVESVPSRKTA
jgi:pimeloyl-ACP methyl ester carboxylesterase